MATKTFKAAMDADRRRWTAELAVVAQMAAYTTASINWADGNRETVASSPREAAIQHATEGWLNAEREADADTDPFERKPVEIRVTAPNGEVSEWLVAWKIAGPAAWPVAEQLHRAFESKPTASTMVSMSLGMPINHSAKLSETLSVEEWTGLSQSDIDDMLWSEVEDALSAACEEWMGNQVEYGWGPA